MPRPGLVLICGLACLWPLPAPECQVVELTDKEDRLAKKTGK